MRTLKTVSYAILLFALMPVAQAMDGNELLAEYHSYLNVKGGTASAADAYAGGLFDGYVSGVFHTSVGIVLCAPNEVKNGHIQAVVGRFLEDQPTILHRSAVLLTTQALMKTFPCK